MIIEGKRLDNRNCRCSIKIREHNQKEAMASKSALNIDVTQSSVLSPISLHWFVLFDSKLPKVLSPLNSILEHSKIIHIWECFRSFSYNDFSK